MPTGDTGLYIHAIIHRLLCGIVSTSLNAAFRLLPSDVHLRYFCKMEIIGPMSFHNYGVSMG